MHDLRHDQEAEDAAAHARLRCNTTWFAGSDTASQRMNPAAAFAELRREFGDVFDAMPEPRTRLEPSQLRTVRQADPRYPDTRTADERMTAELVRLVDAVQALRLRLDVLVEELKAGRL